MGAPALTVYQRVDDEFFITIVRNDNTDRLKSILDSAPENEKLRLANLRDRNNNEPVLNIAIRKGSTYAFDMLADAGAHLSGIKSVHGPNEPIHVVAMYGSLEIAESMRKRGVKPRQNLRNAWPSHIAKHHRHEELAELLEAEESAEPTHEQYLRGRQNAPKAKSAMRSPINKGKIRSKTP